MATTAASPVGGRDQRRRQQRGGECRRGQPADQPVEPVARPQLDVPADEQQDADVEARVLGQVEVRRQTDGYGTWATPA